MEKRISAAEANRKFSSLLRGVQQGKSIVVTSHGKAVARIIPMAADDAARDRAWKRLLKRLETQPVQNIGRWTRDELYED